MRGLISGASAPRRRWRVVLASAVAIGLLGLAPTVDAGVVADAEGTILALPDIGTPEQASTAAFDGLQYGDPSEGIGFVDPPAADSTGAAQLSYPIDIPPGRSGVQPDLSLQYSSRAANGWLGVGWDLPVPTIGVDTRWGVPRYDPVRESETYTFEGEQLFPNAHRSPQLPRSVDPDGPGPLEAERQFTKRVEGDFKRIVRHGNTPADYWFEVHDKVGNKLYFGKVPGDQPIPDPPPPAVLRDDRGNIYSWPLVQFVDISLNTTTYYYDLVEDTGVGGGNQEGSPRGAELYLARINYSGSLDRDDDDDGELPVYGPYDVRFKRDSQLGFSRRDDVIMDARTGGLRVTAERLRRVDVTYNGDLVRRYELGYREGPFAKSLLATVGQADVDGHVFATHRFEYFDDVRSGGDYAGFADSEHWTTGGDDDETTELAGARATALGGSRSSSGDGRIYLGFNIYDGSKGGSVGGGLAFNGSDSESLVEMVDIDGDNLPDKLWRGGDTVYYRLNRSGPSGNGEFGPKTALPSLPHLPEDSSFGVSGGVEGYLGGLANFMFYAGGSFSKARSYFSDVNADGLVDFVDGGTIYFNHLESGVPVFETTSANTAIPLVGNGTIDPIVVPDFAEDAARDRASFALQDTVRRWIAPWSGDIDIVAPVRVTSPDSNDGVRVAIQHNGVERWATTIPGGDTDTRCPPQLAGCNPFLDTDLSFHVERGDRIYFRLQPIDDGAGDAVAWDPVVTYTGQEPTFDVNGLDAYRYVASEEFTLGGRSGIYTAMPYDGTVRLRGTLHKTKVTTDDIVVTVLRNGLGVYSRKVEWDEFGDFEVDSSFPVNGPEGNPPDDGTFGDQVQILLSIDSPIDLSAISWTPELFYTDASDQAGEPVETVQDGRHIIQLHPPYDIDLYPRTNIDSPQGSWTAPDDGDDVPGESFEASVEVDAFVPALALGSEVVKVVATVKSSAGLEAKGNMFLSPPLVPTGTVHDDNDLEFTAVEGRTYFFDLSIRNARVAPFVTGEFEDGDLPSARHWPDLILLDDEGSAFPQSHRGWAYAGYNGDGDRAGQPINEADFILRKDEFEDEPAEGWNEDGDDYTDPMSEGKAYAYAPDPAHDRWRGPKDTAPTDDLDDTPRENARGAVWGAAGGSSTSRLGPDSVGGPPAVELLQGRAPTLTGKTVEVSVAAGFSVGGFSIGAGVGWGRSHGAVDFLDMNGDGYPDIAGNGSVHYTTEVGALELAAREVSELEDVRTNRESSQSFGGGGAPPSIKGNFGGEGNGGGQGSDQGGGGGGDGGDGGGEGSDKKKNKKPSGTTAGVNLGFSGGLGLTRSNSTEFPDNELIYPDDIIEEDLADLNGDGLPDRIVVDESGEVEVAWNLGYRFSDSTAIWPADELEKGSSDGKSAGASVGFNVGAFEFSGGVNIQLDEEHSDVVWTDINGDGLPDRVESEFDGERHRTDVNVRFNTGAGMTGATGWDSWFGDEVGRSESWGVGGGADFTIGIGPLCWPVKLCYIILNPGGHGMRTVTGQRVQLRDVDGDGLADHVESDDDGSMDVKLNTTGRTNLLAEVHRPQGASFTLDYVRVGNTLDEPFPLWNLSEVRLHDGHGGDGDDTRLTRFRYTPDSYYDFREKELYGHKHVIEEHYDGSGTLYRSIARAYRQGNYYERGLLASQTLQDALGRPVRSTVNAYDVVDTFTGGPADLTDVAGSAYPGLAVIEHRWHDSSGDVAKSTRLEYQYDLWGNAVGITDRGEPGPADDALADVRFTQCDGHETFPWTQVPDAMTIRDGTGKVLVRRDANVPCDYAAMNTDDTSRALREYNADSGSDPAITAYSDVTYVDPGGQVGMVAGPANANGEQYTVETTYDPETGQPVTVTDSFGHTSVTTWDNRWGRPATITDANGATTSFTYDERGRLETVTNPAEQGTGTPTITLEYHAGANPPWVAAHLVDPANPPPAGEPADTIDTVRFVDGLGQELQTKHDATVFDGAGAPARDVMVVSGSVRRDAFGRTVSARYQGVEVLGTLGLFDPDIGGPATTTEYAVTDLVTKEVKPGLRVTTHHYGFDATTFASTMFAVTTADPESKVTVAYSDVRGNAVGQARRYTSTGAQKTLLTRFSYDALQRLVSTVEPDGATSSVTYDMLGRRAAVQTPSAGLVEWVHDLAGNPVAQITPNLRATGQAIAYDYSFNRLVGIRYPLNPKDNVTYTYGEAGPDNGAGRVVAIDDGARTTTRSFDLLGNVVSETSVMKVKNLSVDTIADHTFTTAFHYDTWSRPLSMTYPDGEALTYGYGAGGLVDSATGVKNGISLRYVDRLEYDEFGHRRFLSYHNGLTTEITYDPDTLRLQRQLVLRGSTEVQDLNYTYDKVGNVLTRVDDISVPTSPSQFGGPTEQTFTYDDLHRLSTAQGTYRYAPKNTRDYTLANTYDDVGRVKQKTQTDRINGKLQKLTTYSNGYAYGAAARTPAKIGIRTYTADLNGNLTGYDEGKGGKRRSMVWDEVDRLRVVADGGSESSFNYDDTGRMVVETSTQGEVEYVNDFFTAANGTSRWKNVFVGDLHVVLTRADSDNPVFRYFLTSDLGNSTNLVTGFDGAVYEHLEYFPGGEIWVREKSEVYREPHLFAGQYYDENRLLFKMGARWYDGHDGVMYSPDPVLSSSPADVIGEPRLLGAYGYGYDNPLRYIDDSGLTASESIVRYAKQFKEGIDAFKQDLNDRRHASEQRHTKLVGLAESKKFKRVGKVATFTPDVSIELDFSGISKVSDLKSPSKLLSITKFKVLGFKIKRVDGRFAVKHPFKVKDKAKT